MSSTSNSRASVVSTQLLAALNMALLACLVIGGFTAYQNFHMKFRAAATFLNTPERLTPQVQGAIREAASTFILGPVNGSIAVLLSNLLRSERFASVASDLKVLSGDIASSFHLAPSTVCDDYITCPTSPNGWYPFNVACASGTFVSCEYYGQRVNCASKSCVTKYVYSVATMVHSVSGLVEQLNGPEQSSSSGAALSSGLLNMEVILPWIQQQANVEQWAAVGERCLKFTKLMRSISWSGEYSDFDGNYHHYNVTHNVGNVVSYVEQVCGDLVTLPGAFPQQE